MNNRVIILAIEDPSQPLFKDTVKALGSPYIDPINFINPESHALANLYRDMFKDELANQLMGYLVHKQENLLVWDIIGEMGGIEDKLIVVNATLLTEEDIRFLTSVEDHVLVYELEGSPERCARDIYDGSKSYRDAAAL